MSILFGQSPDTGEQKNLEQLASQGLQGANPNVGIVPFAPSAATTGALPAAISGYQKMIQSPTGFAPQEQAALTEGRVGGAQEAAAGIKGAEAGREAKGQGSSGEEEAQQAVAESGQATGGAEAGTKAAAAGANARMQALGGETAAGGVQAKLMDTTQLAGEENQQRMMQQQFLNALQKSGAYSGLMKDYSGTQQGGGYGLLGKGLAMPYNDKGDSALSNMGSGATDLVSLLGLGG